MDTMTKAASHSVTPTPAGFAVLSGTSGASYLVVPLSTGGAACNCAHGRHSSAIAARCSHVRAVESFAAKVTVPADPFRGFRDPAPAKPACWLCDGTGVVETVVCAHGTRSRRDECSAACVRAEKCSNCYGSREPKN